MSNLNNDNLIDNILCGYIGENEREYLESLTKEEVDSMSEELQNIYFNTVKPHRVDVICVCDDCVNDLEHALGN